jgi:hypothetical protein
LATGKHFQRYIVRKIDDQDTWEGIDEEHYSGDVTGVYGRTFQKAQMGDKKFGEKVKKAIKRK